MATPTASDAYELARATAIMVGYDCRWLPAMERLEVLYVEAEYRAPLVNPETGDRTIPADLMKLIGDYAKAMRERQDAD